MAWWGCEVGRSSLAVTWAFTCPGSRNRDVATIPSHMPEGMNAGALVLAQASASFSRSELRWEFANISAAVVFLFLAFAAIALFCFRRGTRDPTLIYFALFCLLYGVRVLAHLPFFRSLFNESPTFWNYLALVISNKISRNGI